MKKIFIIILMFTMALAGYSQEKVKKEKKRKDLPTPYLEFWGGMGLSSVSGDLSGSEGRLTGLFGAGFTLPISKKNNIHAEIAYTFQGFNYDALIHVENDGDTLSLRTREQRFNYFKINVMDRYFIDKKRTFYVNGGFYAAYLSQARYMGTYYVTNLETGNEEIEDFDIENRDTYQRADFGLTGGIGVRLGNKKASNFTIEARASYGLMNVLKEPILGRDYSISNFYGVLKLGVDIPVKN